MSTLGSGEQPVVESTTNEIKHDVPPDGDSANGSTGHRKEFSSHLLPLQVKDAVSPFLEKNPIGFESEREIALKIEQLSQLESPQLRELARWLGQVYKHHTPRYAKAIAPSPYTGIVVGARWEEIQGSKGWAGLLDPIDPVLRSEIVRYGEFAQASYDSFDGDPNSKYCGSCKYMKDVLLERVGLDNRGYEITDFLYATADSVPSFFSKSLQSETWSKDSNWMGFVAVCTSKTEITRLGRRDILVAWRGTIRPLEWVEDIKDYLSPAGFDPRHGESDVDVESGFLSVYISSNAKSRFNKFSAREQVLRAVKELVEKYENEKDLDLSITVVGHSLGSALATLNAYDIAESGMNLRASGTPMPEAWNPQRPENLKNVQPVKDVQPVKGVQPVSGNKISGKRHPITVFSFAGPKVGNTAFRDRVDELGVAVLRVVNIHDVVPKVPGSIFQPELDVLQKLVTCLPAYKHVGEKLEVDNLLSSLLKENTNPVDIHNLELYVHLVDAYHGKTLPYKPTLRDYALVNKGGDFLKKEFYIPTSWWQPENKGLVRDKDGHWIVPVPDASLFPKTPASSKSTEDQKADFQRSVEIAVKRSEDITGIVPQVLPPKPVAKPSATPV